MVSWNDPPTKLVRRTHRRQRLAPDPLRRRLGIEQVAGDENVAGFVVPGRRRQRVDGRMTGFYQPTRMSSGYVLNLLPKWRSDE